MTEEALTRIAEALHTHEGTSNWDGPYGTGGDDVYDDAAALLAEVRRLRGLLEEICRIEPDEKSDGTILGELAHGAEEMAEIAYEAVHTSPSRVR